MYYYICTLLADRIDRELTCTYLYMVSSMFLTKYRQIIRVNLQYPVINLQLTV